MVWSLGLCLPSFLEITEFSHLNSYELYEPVSLQALYGTGRSILSSGHLDDGRKFLDSPPISQTDMDAGPLYLDPDGRIDSQHDGRIRTVGHNICQEVDELRKSEGWIVRFMDESGRRTLILTKGIWWTRGRSPSMEASIPHCFNGCFTR